MKLIKQQTIEVGDIRDRFIGCGWYETKFVTEDGQVLIHKHYYLLQDCDYWLVKNNEYLLVLTNGDKYDNIILGHLDQFDIDPTKLETI